MVKDMESESEFRSVLESAGSKPVLVDFYADWCGPCRAISPKVNDLASRNPGITFVKVNVDKLESVASQYSVTSLPSFIIFIRGQKMEVVTGAQADKLEALVKKFASSGDGGEKLAGGHMDLASLVAANESECLNESDTHNLKSILGQEVTPNAYLESDCDEQLVIFLSFSQNVKLHSLKLTAPFENAPKNIKIFANQHSPINFDAAEGAEGIQALTLTADEVADDADPVQLKYVKLQNVGTLTIFVHDNQAGSEVTRISRIQLFGSPVATTNMTDFKRVAGKAGEGHE